MGKVSTHKCVDFLARLKVVGSHVGIRGGLQKAKIKFIHNITYIRNRVL